MTISASFQKQGRLLEVADTNGNEEINSSETENRITDPCAHGLFLKYHSIKPIVHFQGSEFLPDAQVKKVSAKFKYRLKLQHTSANQSHILPERTEKTTGVVSL